MKSCCIVVEVSLFFVTLTKIVVFCTYTSKLNIHSGTICATVSRGNASRCIFTSSADDNYTAKWGCRVQSYLLVGSCFWIPRPFSWKLCLLVVLGTLDGDLKNELQCPSRFLGESPEKQRFPKWPPSVPNDHECFICGAILTNKRSILTNSGMGILFLTFILP